MSESWVNSAERIGSDLLLELAGPGSRRAVLIRALRDAVRAGRLPPGTRLPPYRSLAADLGLARNTVADAYAELVAEGWLTARQGSGTRVAHRAPAAAPARIPKKAPSRPAPPVHNLRQGQPDAASFPRTAWLAASRRAVNAAPNDAFGPGDPQGRVELRRALSGYLARVRGVHCSPERIVICSGFAHALRLLFGGGVLRGPLAVESYGLGFHRSLLVAAGVRTVPLTLDEHGARTGELTGLPGVRSVLLTPAHQFPTGGPLHPERRTAVVDWARTRGGLVLEDDYDGEFRYDREPVSAVQGLGPDRVVHLGSVSKSLSPAIRLGWMVLPEHLVGAVLAAKGEREGWASVLDQLALADFIESGHYDRHIRRMRQRYRHRRDQLVAALAAHAPHITPTGVAAGLHAVLRLPPGTERSTVKAAAWQGLGLDPLADFRHPAATMPAEDGLVVGYATPPDHAYGAALEALCRALPPPPGA
ncbi:MULTISPECIES: PLP-dependent aminotransferase family protein [Streptomyces]|jgi:GntR family transcriptional regulator/MocR family aminotransferase|uniref:MocR-like pyridoxine biosynthesis transcription factor PdxR n=1 Tax=unclassified Streptomyces TaxID=2593676 RepID=UPI0008E6C228|nr:MULTISPECIES: PLP-dependent aminotransferase family protein [unclassified Streptomyces]MDX2730022.1 PLP-dependent aminotransferase family protein [Streptomyces sp. PA03-2a]MDX3765951.1 PLP-dependent aminotransferase family protein [Streptomyces sp. AK08-01B]MDX3815876.1 PLP-dependent aminotransferase family protein [Streptomyces sp. AK08-01A]SFS60270.1 GntR family transcriptional regulator / MocR family aminotransferase [Streptomyces sp. ok210]